MHSFLAPGDAFALGLDEWVDERRQRRSAEDDEDCQEQENDDYRDEPPLLVMGKEPGELGKGFAMEASLVAT